jgi:RecA-family ATPase
MSEHKQGAAENSQPLKGNNFYKEIELKPNQPQLTLYQKRYDELHANFIQYRDTFNGEIPKEIRTELEGLRLMLGIGSNPSLTDLIFIPNWDNKPPETPPVITLNGEGILGFQNLTAIIAAPGSGKSAICEAVAAAVINSGADCLGFQVSQDCTHVIYIDFERTKNDVWNSFNRMCRRAGVKYGDIVTNVVIAGMRSIPKLGERKKAILDLLNNNECSLLILDGAGDMVTDTNDIEQAVECTKFLRQLTVDFQLSILTTLHPNPNSFKPRGHIGSEAMREADAVLVIKKGEAESRIITTDFEHGKNRNGSHAEGAFTWSDNNMMFISVDVNEMKFELAKSKENKQKEKAKEILKKVFAASIELSYKDAWNSIAEHEGTKERSAKQLLANCLKWGLVDKNADSIYTMVQECKLGAN